jgi:hypothetical protein
VADARSYRIARQLPVKVSRSSIKALADRK